MPRPLVGTDLQAVIDVHGLKCGQHILAPQLRGGVKQYMGITTATEPQPKALHGGKLPQDGG